MKELLDESVGCAGYVIIHVAEYLMFDSSGVTINGVFLSNSLDMLHILLCMTPPFPVRIVYVSARYIYIYIGIQITRMVHDFVWREGT